MSLSRRAMALGTPRSCSSRSSAEGKPRWVMVMSVFAPLASNVNSSLALSVNVRRDAHHRGINDLEGENGERRTCWRRARMELEQRLRLARRAGGGARPGVGRAGEAPDVHCE